MSGEEKAGREGGGSPRKVRIRPVPAVTRALAILRLLGEADHAIGLKDISDKLNMIPSTCLHILRVLVSEQLVSVDVKTKRYELGFGILSMARKRLREYGSLRTIQPDLIRLASEFGVTITITKIIDLRHSVVLFVTHSDRPMRLNVEIGSRFPTLISATGRCYAAFGNADVDEIKSGFDELRWHRAPEFATWMMEVKAAKVAGYAVDSGNYLAGATVIALPVFDRIGEMAYSIAAVRLGTESKSNEKKLVKCLIDTIEQVEYS